MTAEEVPVGQTLDLGSHPVPEEEIIRFASEWDSQYFHIDPAVAQESYFGGLGASGIHTLSIYQRLSVNGLFERYDVIAGKEARHVRFIHPVRAGDVLTGTVFIDSVEHDGRGRATVITTGSLRNQDDVVVLRLQMEALIAANAKST
ncbi:MaoC/PaaZ C-terminal domain-containing protein [Arthrobacter roseus]|uniref:MaoC/PaaZ C-terminal domain-containing protein n=1 Tax=Arthrobacter roseus TaxID=136274 RepID=UPI001965B9E2|nr:MaoC/PaaZ C-terminal domain-containing protein [Arthrobacter roseus]MBM7848443.1 acyl dehydratase [Arthrobacter roseus]